MASDAVAQIKSLIAKRSYAAAAELCEAETALRPTNASVRILHGMALCALHQYSAARTTLTVAVRLSPRSAPAYRLLGEALLRSGSAASAREALETAVAIAPSDTAAMELLEEARRIPGDIGPESNGSFDEESERTILDAIGLVGEPDYLDSGEEPTSMLDPAARVRIIEMARARDVPAEANLPTPAPDASRAGTSSAPPSESLRGPGDTEETDRTDAPQVRSGRPAPSPSRRPLPAPSARPNMLPIPAAIPPREVRRSVAPPAPFVPTASAPVVKPIAPLPSPAPSIPPVVSSTPAREVTAPWNASVPVPPFAPQRSPSAIPVAHVPSPSNPIPPVEHQPSHSHTPIAPTPARRTTTGVSRTFRNPDGSIPAPRASRKGAIFLALGIVVVVVAAAVVGIAMFKRRNTNEQEALAQARQALATGTRADIDAAVAYRGLKASTRTLLLGVRAYEEGLRQAGRAADVQGVIASTSTAKDAESQIGRAYALLARGDISGAREAVPTGADVSTELACELALLRARTDPKQLGALRLCADASPATALRIRSRYALMEPDREAGIRELPSVPLEAPGGALLQLARSIAQVGRRTPDETVLADLTNLRTNADLGEADHDLARGALSRAYAQAGDPYRAHLELEDLLRHPFLPAAALNEAVAAAMILDSSELIARALTHSARVEDGSLEGVALRALATLSLGRSPATAALSTLEGSMYAPLVRGALQESSGDVVAADASYEEASRHEPLRTQALVRRARLTQKRHDPLKALDYAEAARQRAPSDAEVLVLNVDLRAMLGDRAIDRVLDAAVQISGTPLVTLLRTERSIIRGEPSAPNSTGASPDDPWVRYANARIAFARGNKEEARSLLARTQNAVGAPLAERVALLAALIGDVPLRERGLASALQATGPEEASSLRARTAVVAGLGAEGLADSRAHGETLAAAVEAELLAQSEEWTAASNLLERRVAVDATDADSWLVLAWVRMNRTKRGAGPALDSAETAARRFGASRGFFARLWALRALTSLESRDVPAAERLIAQARELDSSMSQVHYVAARVAEAAGADPFPPLLLASRAENPVADVFFRLGMLEGSEPIAERCVHLARYLRMAPRGTNSRRARDLCRPPTP